MIEVAVWKAKNNVTLQKNGTFIEGESYFGRLSKDGSCYVVRSEEGYWIPVVRYTWARRRNVGDYFNRSATIFMKNRKRLNEFASVEQYFDGNNCRKWWYATQFKDNQLGGFL